jgi:cob(I)alamin adenosyltransferase
MKHVHHQWATKSKKANAKMMMATTHHQAISALVGAAQRHLIRRRRTTYHHRTIATTATSARKTSHPYTYLTMLDPAASQKTDDIEDAHLAACRRGEALYLDPTTGLSCFTEVAHLQRGVCCGNRCRHCPYGWQNVRNGSYGTKHTPAKLMSGDKVACARLLQDEFGLSSDGTVVATNGGGRTKKNVPYTRRGDAGKSRLPSGENRRKDDILFEAMGTVDELCSFVGVCHANLVTTFPDDPLTNDWLVDVMSRLFDIGSFIATQKKQRVENDDHDDDSADDDSVDEDNDDDDDVRDSFASHVTRLEQWIDDMTARLPNLTSFILPTGSILSAHFHVARTVCRRAERLNLHQPYSIYLNRLSDFLFTAARYANHLDQRPDLRYVKPHGSSQRAPTI